MSFRSRSFVVAVAVAAALGLGVVYEAHGASSRAAIQNADIASLARRVSVLEHKLTLQVEWNRAQSKINSTQSNLNASFSGQISELQGRPQPTFQTVVQVAFGTADSQGAANATAYCPAGLKVFGGGGGFVGQAYYADHLLWSHADIAGTSWTAAGDGYNGGRSFEVYAVCGSIH